MIVSVQQAKYELLAYIKEFDATFSKWYIGISDNPKRDLFEVHGVKDAEDPWIYKQLLTARAARTVHTYFTEHMKMRGVPSESESEDFDCVYLYKMDQHTRQV